MSAQNNKKPGFGLQPAQVQPEDAFEGRPSRSTFLTETFLALIYSAATHCFLSWSGGLEARVASSSSGKLSTTQQHYDQVAQHLTETPLTSMQLSVLPLAAASAKEAAALRQASTADKKGAVDPIIQSFLKNARSEAVRQEFLSMPQGEYTSKHNVEVLVSSHQH